jgi:hypothetical protein
MFKKTLIALGLLGVTGLAGCVVVEPRHHYYRAGYAYVEPAPIVVAPVFGFYGGRGYGGYGYGYYGYHGGYRHWR